MGRFKLQRERLFKKLDGDREKLCKSGNHQESTKAPGKCVHCGVTKIESKREAKRDCKDVK